MMGVGGKRVWRAWRVWVCMGMRMGLHGQEWVCMDESLEREMDMRGSMGVRGTCMGMRMGLHGNGNGLAWTRMCLHG